MSITEVGFEDYQFKFDSLKKEVYVYNFFEKQYDLIRGYAAIGIEEKMLEQDKCLKAIAFLKCQMFRSYSFR